MIHSIQLIGRTDFRYSWARIDSGGSSQRLRSFYKSHPGIVRFMRFPLKYRLWRERERDVYTTYTYERDRMAATPSSLNFDAKVWDLNVDEIPHPLITQGYRYLPRLGMLRQHFIAPFRKSNEALVLNADVPLQLINSESTLVLLDMCQEQGAKLNRDFEFTKREKYIVPKSDDMRLMLADKIGDWPEFDMMFTISHPVELSYTVTIDDLK